MKEQGHIWDKPLGLDVGRKTDQPEERDKTYLVVGLKCGKNTELACVFILQNEPFPDSRQERQGTVMS